MKCSCLFFVAGLAVSALPVVGFSQTVLSGDHVIEPGLADTGSLIISGDLQIEGNRTDFGTTSEGHAALLMSYLEDGLARQVVVYASKDAVDYLWKEGSGDPLLARPKMSLGADNTLSLYDASGVEKITLSPVTGEISAYGGVRLPDGTLLSGSHSLRSTALYNIGGEKVAEVLEDGTIAFGGGVILGGANGAKLTEKGVDYLTGVLQNFGYRENEPTEVNVLLGNSSAGGRIVKTDTAGNRYVAGSFTGASIQLGSLRLNRVSGSKSWFVVKYSAEGDVLWSRVWSVHSDSSLPTLAVNAAGDVCVSGRIPVAAGGTLTLAGVSATGMGGLDGILLKLDSAGVGQWLKIFGGLKSDGINGIALDDSGNVYVAGHLSGDMGADANLAGVTVTASGVTEGFFAKLNGAGTVQWVKPLGVMGMESKVLNISVDALGNVYAVGTIRDDVIATRNLLGIPIQLVSTLDGFIVKTNADGQPQWAKSFGSRFGYDTTNLVSTDTGGNVYVAGTINYSAWSSSPSTPLLGGMPVHPNGGTSAFLLKFDSSGVGIWAHLLGAAGGGRIDNFTLDASGNIYLIGRAISNSAELANLAGVPLEVSAGTTNYLLALDAEGAGQWAKAVSATLNSIAYTANDNLIVSGLSGNNDFILGTQRIQSSRDFIAEFPSASQPHDEVIFDGVSLAWGNAKALGVASIALGESARAEGSYSVSLGRNAVASAYDAVAIGAQASATGLGSTVIGGAGNSTSADYSIIIGGMWNEIYGYGGSIIGGEYNNASGRMSSVIGGGYNNASGRMSSVIGGNANSASGRMSVALGGYSNDAAGDYAAVLGGMINAAMGNYSVASGYISRAQAAYSVVIGSSNVSQGHSTDWVSTDDLFVVGNGDPSQESGELSNALALHKNGNMRLAGDLEAKGKIRVAPSGDISMGAFTAGSNPATLGAGLRYTEE